MLQNCKHTLNLKNIFIPNLKYLYAEESNKLEGICINKKDQNIYFSLF